MEAIATTNTASPSETETPVHRETTNQTENFCENTAAYTRSQRELTKAGRASPVRGLAGLAEPTTP